MVISAEKEEARRQNMNGLVEKRTTFSPSRRSKPQSRLHNFSFPTLSWGNQKLLRCVNPSGRSIDEELQTGRRCSSPSSLNELQAPPPPPPQPRLTGKKQGLEEEAKESNPLGLSASTRWNLRSKRAARNAPTEIFWNRNTSPSSSQSQSFSYSPLQKEKTSSPMFLVTRLEGFDMTEKGERPKFSIALSREEIEEDFLAAKGTKPPRRPKKRAKYLQRQLDALFPGAFLSEVTSDLYKIEEIAS
ncbi:uncharacterized protein LOC110111882 [Dendrobium catenatum]|uniref:Uncharacterized protein n=1 Tax=Dendrobium catenatum TaxID=906689 RepID=A0A2I0VZW6_9ASPA|nr:uncharacterized protein LOC110111882 [Dendrobium catenatum]PKU68955.1 hypothetical protein MA16_Dca002223 [Dendrobium catenatum]